jgi:hypothetical protein
LQKYFDLDEHGYSQVSAGMAPEDQSSVDLFIQKPSPILELKAGLEKLLTGQQ